MLFTELRFFVFFAAVFAIVWMLRKNNWRKIVLTGASYVFYGAWDWRFLGLILLITAVCYVSGLKVGQDNPNKRERQLWVSLSVIFSLAVLGLFKYFNFFADSFADLAHVVGLPVNNVTLGLVLPPPHRVAASHSHSHARARHNNDARALHQQQLRLRGTAAVRKYPCRHRICRCDSQFGGCSTSGCRSG